MTSANTVTSHLKVVVGEKCDAKALGFTCDREPNHGALHHSPPEAFPVHIRDTWWMFEPTCDCERMGRRPMTGYVIVTDKHLPRGPHEPA